MTRTVAEPLPTPRCQAWLRPARPELLEKEVLLVEASSPVASQGSRPRCEEQLGEKASVAGALLIPYEDEETCVFILSEAGASAHFATLRVGPVGSDGLIVREESVKVAGGWAAGSQLQWALRGLPLATMASKSPLGLVAGRFKIWVDSYFSRWLGRSLLFAVPSPRQVVLRQIFAETRRGAAGEAAIAAGAQVVDIRDGLGGQNLEKQGLQVQALPPEYAELEEVPRRPQEALIAAYAEALGTAVVDAAVARQWGIARALLEELRWSPEEVRRGALAKADATRKTALRLCVDGLGKETKQLLRALEGGTLRLILGTRRQYWWSFKVKTVCCNTLWFNGEMCIGMPRVTGCAAAQPLSWQSCLWSEPQEHDGQLEDLGGAWNFNVDDGTKLRLRFLPAGEVETFGQRRLRNFLGLPMLVASGTVAGKSASGMFDATSCGRLAAELTALGPRAVARLCHELGAGCRALADDGLSAYTAAILHEDPCGLLQGLEPQLRRRLLRDDESAWAEAARSLEGGDLPDMAAGALSRGLLIPKKMAEELLAYCFEADLPLLALRVLFRIDGKRFLMRALEKESLGWQRVAERLVEQAKPGQRPYWLTPVALKYAVQEVQQGRSQFRILLRSFMSFLKASEEQDFLSDPCVLAQRGGAECPVCLEPLCRSRPVAFVADSAVCLHFLCAGCARGYASATSAAGDALRCPECRRHAVAMRPLPELCEDPLGWFEFLSSDSTLARPMLLRALSALLPLDSDAFEAHGEPLEQQVDAASFISNSLYVWLWRHLREQERCIVLGPAPDLQERREWFRYWNFSKKELSRAEVLRAILRSFRATEASLVLELRRRLDQVWETWRRGGGTGAVRLEEFPAFADLLEEAFGSDGSDLHRPKEAPLGQRPLSRLPYRLQPRPKAAPPPPDLAVPSEMPPRREARRIQDLPPAFLGPVGLYAWQSESSSEETASESSQDDSPPPLVAMDSSERCMSPRGVMSL